MDDVKIQQQLLLCRTLSIDQDNKQDLKVNIRRDWTLAP